MKHSGKIVLLFSFCCLALIFMSGDAYAADVLQTVRDKAASFIKSLRPLIFILAGFGLIGFAFGAIFGKISWKWFANIAIGLFLVANVGLFIDYFATRSGAAGQYAQDLGYGKYLDASGGYTPTDGSPSDPQSQKTPSESGDGQDNSSSENADSTCVPGTGTGCEKNYFENVNEDLLDPSKDMAMQNCTLTGGKWNSSSSSCEYEALNSPISIPGINNNTNNTTNNNTSNVPSGEQMNSLAKKAQDQYNSNGKIDMNQLLRDEIAAGNMTPEQAAQAGAIFTEVANATGGDVGKAIEDVLRGSQEQMEEEKEKANENQSADMTASGSSSDSSVSANQDIIDGSGVPSENQASEVGDLFNQLSSGESGAAPATENSGTDTPSNEPKQNQTDTEKQQCTANNGYWDGEKCITSSGGVDMSNVKEVVTLNGRPTGITENGRYVDLETGKENTSMDLIDADGNEWLYNQETQEYFNPKTGETTTAEMLRAEGPVYDADQYKENQEKRACMLKFSKGYSWVNGKCLTPEETAEKEAQEQKEKEEKTKKYCKEGQEYIGEGDMTGPICVDTEETKAKKKAEQERELAEKQKECESRKGYEWKNRRCVLDEATTQAKRECTAAKMKWNSETLTCEKTEKQLKEEKRANNPELAAKIDAQREVCDKEYTACRTEARRYGTTSPCKTSDPEYDMCYYNWKIESQERYNACSDKNRECYQKVRELEAQL